MKKKLLLTLGLLGVMFTSLIGSEAFAHDRRDYRDGWRNYNQHGWGHKQRSYRHAKRYHRAANRSNWWRNNNRVAYRPGNRWGNYYPTPRRSWW
jgi:hypothetical protein